MKTEVKNVKKTTYICEECGEKYSDISAAEECERLHKCKHEKVTYLFNENDEYADYFDCVDLYCEDCNTRIERECLWNADLNQTAKKMIFEILKKCREGKI